jgi:hypothetical protein
LLTMREPEWLESLLRLCDVAYPGIALGLLGRKL